MPETEIDFAPGPLGSARRRLPPLIAGLAIVAFLGLAVAKPWATPASQATASPTTPPASAALADDSAPTGAPDATADGPRPTGIASGTQPPVGIWGVGLGVGATAGPTDPAIEWLAWTPVTPLPERPEAPTGAPATMVTDCASVPTLAAVGTSTVGVTVPATVSNDFSILAWWSGGLAPVEVDDFVDRIDLPDRAPIAELARVDGLPWPDGRYEFHVITSDHVTSLGFCIDSSIAP